MTAGLVNEKEHNRTPSSHMLFWGKRLPALSIVSLNVYAMVGS